MAKSKNYQKMQEGLRADDFRKKAKHYLVCFLESCPLHDECFRYQVGLFVDTEPLARTAINPLHKGVATNKCPMFRQEQRVIVKLGLTKLYNDMPHRIELAIRNKLRMTFGYRQYYEMRKGDRPIDPEAQQTISDICRQYGWDGPVVYDGEAEDWGW